ncbi:CO-responsive transcriptional regulator RcoM [Octadecabacter ascidiaceicola]|uniref:CO-responsive transcriptional regulator RcoM n=2 Tax=Octadecabacter ascidiaceicola TaxID=1655543 RepID=A0A238JRZ4_9RHOB|nr:CO-responsive transcriptional regulator RcoM [Octadecabacter ascidiaceicola]
MVEPTRVASFLGASLILAIVGPFETDTAMLALPRFAYWGIIVVLCYSVGYFGNIYADHLAGPRAGLLRRLFVAVPLTAIGVLAVVYILNGLALNYWATGRELVVIASNVIVISAIITAVFYVANSHNAKTEIPASGPSLQDRIPFDKRGSLISVSVEDHYVRVRTTKGEEMILMRLADAMREVGDTPGLQVHRSHWIALDQVTSVARKGDGAVLSMSQGPDIPVSRANISKIKEAGLLPRT